MENKVNHARVYFDARSMNEGFARMVVMGLFLEQLQQIPKHLKLKQRMY